MSASSPKASIPNAVAYGIRAASPDVWQELDELRQKLRMIISHASGGHLSKPGDVDRSTNDICVEISRHNNLIWNHAQAAALGGTSEEAEANARLIAAAPDHALIGWAMCVQDATWEEWGVGKGEFCFAGLRHATTLDEFGCPVLTENLRELLTKARDGE